MRLTRTDCSDCAEVPPPGTQPLSLLMIAAASPSINALDVLGSTSDINMKGNGGRARNALHIAAIVNQSQNVSLILKAGVNVHATAERGITPLCLACMCGHGCAMC